MTINKYKIIIIDIAMNEEDIEVNFNNIVIRENINLNESNINYYTNNNNKKETKIDVISDNKKE